jgi:hypothetical protein
VFALSYDEDGRDPDGTAAVIQQRCPAAEILDVPGIGFEDSERDSEHRYAYLADIRNRLLRIVAAIGPAYYLSLDSDILMRPDALSALLRAADGRGAVGGLIDMGGAQMPGHWSWMHLDGDDAYRSNQRVPLATDWPGPIGENEAMPQLPSRLRVGVIMGCKLMSPNAYRNARYADHVDGEDVGWAIQARAMNVPLWLVPAARGEHILRY